MQANIAAELDEWKSIFKQELLAHLEELTGDKDIYGFAIEVPDDLGNLGIISAIGRESVLANDRKGFMALIDRRYSTADWEYLPNGKSFDKSCDRLEEIGRNHGNVFISESCEYTNEGIEFRDSLYAACLDVMADCDSRGAFGDIWFKVITLSDGDHPIIRESFHRLNKGRARREAGLLYNGKGILGGLCHQIGMVIRRLLRL